MYFCILFLKDILQSIHNSKLLANLNRFETHVKHKQIATTNIVVAGPINLTGGSTYVVN